VADERRQQLELERGEPHRPPFDGHLAADVVDPHSAVLVGGAHLRRPARAAQQRLDAREQLLAPERLRDVVVRAAAQPAHLVELARARGQDQHRHVAQVADPLERLPAVELGHRDVEHDEVGGLLVQPAQRLEPVRRLRHAVAGSLEQHAHETAYVVLVLHDEHISRLHVPCIPDVHARDPGRRAHANAASRPARSCRRDYVSRWANARALMWAIA